MFIAMTARVLLTPSGVKCSNVLRAHGTPDGVRASRRLDCYKRIMKGRPSQCKFGAVEVTKLP
jgi:hypothetical protein